jgi:hypothetical protein
VPARSTLGEVERSQITNDEAQRFSLCFYTIKHDSEYVIDVEVDDSGLDPQSEHTVDSLIILVPCKIREAASTRNTAQEGNVRTRDALKEQQDRYDGRNDDTFQNAEQEDTNQGYSRDRKLQPAYPPQSSDFPKIDSACYCHQHNGASTVFGKFFKNPVKKSRQNASVIDAKMSDNGVLAPAFSFTADWESPPATG